MQANRDHFERKQLLQAFGEPDYDSPLLSASKTEHKRKAFPVSTKDRSDKKRAKSIKKASSASKSKTILDVSVEELPSLIHMLSASTKRIM
jgi:hypothetical protein